ncbi:MAG: DUF3352 domain-containing protein [Dehalococcoidia bacterium]
MPALPRRAAGIGITAVLALVAAVVAIFVLTTSSKAGEVNLTTARLVPADAGLYVAINTDLASDQWVAAFNLAERLGAENPRQTLKDEAFGMDWDDEIAPFLGGNAAFFLRQVDVEMFDFQGGVIVKCKDEKKCSKVFVEQSGFDFEKTTYQGIEYAMSDGMALFAVIDGHLVVTTDEDSMKAVIDVHKGKAKSLASTADFQNLRDELTKNFLSFIYLNTEELTGDFLLNEPAIKQALEQSGTSDIVFKPMAMVASAKSEGFEYAAASTSDGGVAGPMLQPHVSKFAKVVPQNASVFMTTNNLAQTWKDAVTKSRADIDKAIRDEGTYRDLDEALRDAGRQVGLKSIEEIIELLNGEAAIAAWFPGGRQEDATGLLLFEVSDEAKARSVLDRVFNASAVGKPTKETVGGVELTVITGEDRQKLAYGITNGYALVGSLDAVKATVDRKENPLADLGIYQRATNGQTLGTYAFFNLTELTRLTEGGVPPVLDEMTQALEALMYNAVEVNGVARVTGLVTISK